MRHVGLFFGSFNPIHYGHLMLAQYMLNYANVDEVWFVVSPQNPFKEAKDLLPEKLRLQMVELAIVGDPCMLASDVEFNLPKPSYTVNTLEKLRADNPDCDFSIVMGSDNLAGLPKWREYKKIIDNHRIIVYPRIGADIVRVEGARVDIADAPLLNISSSLLRQWMAHGKSIHHYTPDSVIDFINKNKLYCAD